MKLREKDEKLIGCQKNSVPSRDQSIRHHHTGISCQNFFHSSIIPPGGCLGCLEKQTSSMNYNLFVWSDVFQPKWNDNKQNLEKLSKSREKLMVFEILSKFVQFWLENSNPNQIDELKWIILLLLKPNPSLEVE